MQINFQSSNASDVFRSKDHVTIDPCYVINIRKYELTVIERFKYETAKLRVI